MGTVTFILTFHGLSSFSQLLFSRAGLFTAKPAVSQSRGCPDDTFPLFFFPLCIISCYRGYHMLFHKICYISQLRLEKDMFLSSLCTLNQCQPTLQVHLYFLWDGVAGQKLLFSCIVSSLLNSTCSSDKLFKINTFK